MSLPLQAWAGLARRLTPPRPSPGSQHFLLPEWGPSVWWGQGAAPGAGAGRSLISLSCRYGGGGLGARATALRLPSSVSSWLSLLQLIFLSLFPPHPHPSLGGSLPPLHQCVYWRMLGGSQFGAEGWEVWVQPGDRAGAHSHKQKFWPDPLPEVFFSVWGPSGLWGCSGLCFPWPPLGTLRAPGAG